jgi:hypothetical protein
MTVGQVAESNPNLLTRQLQQSTFGIMNDAQLLCCEFDDSLIPISTESEEVYEEVSYSRKIRNHSVIKGQDVLVALSEYGKLVFMTLYCDESLSVKRFETLTEVKSLESNIKLGSITHINFLFFRFIWTALD